MSDAKDKTNPAGASIGEVADRLVKSYSGDAQLTGMAAPELPSPPEVSAVLTELRELLFPGFSGGTRTPGASLKAQVEARLAKVRVQLAEQVFRGLCGRCKQVGSDRGRCEEKAGRITDAFLDALPDLHALLMTDARAAFEGDPAATGADEVVFSYPGIQAISVYRIAHTLRRLGALIVPRMMTELAHSETGIDIHPGASIGRSFFIDHGTGVVIGETTVIGDRVRIYQGVTLGALSVPTDKVRTLSTTKRHPTIEDEVIIYANATILGGDTVIGCGAVIGGNSWITESVPAGARRSV